MVSNSINVNNTNTHLSLQTIGYKNDHVKWRWNSISWLGIRTKMWRSQTNLCNPNPPHHNNWTPNRARPDRKTNNNYLKFSYMVWVLGIYLLLAAFSKLYQDMGEGMGEGVSVIERIPYVRIYIQLQIWTNLVNVDWTFLGESMI